MQVRIFGYNAPPFGNRTFVPVEEITETENLSKITFELLLRDVDGFNPSLVILDASGDRGNGLPVGANSYGYDGKMHVFSLYNASDDDVTAMLELSQMTVMPYLYFCPYSYNGAPFYDSKTLAILRYINQNGIITNQTPVLNPVPSAIRVVVNNFSIAGNNGINANKEFDIDYSVYGIGNSVGLLDNFK